MQGRRPIDLRGIHIGATFEQRANHRLIASFCGVGHGRAFGRQSGTGRGNHQESESSRSSPMHMRLPQRD
jgi:hypothetical protein